MSYRVELERFGAVVTVETVTEVRDLLEAIYPRIEMTGHPTRALGELLDEARPSTLEEIPQGPRRRQAPTPRPELPDTSAEAALRSERGLLELMRDRPRRLQELADASGMGRTTALEYLKRMADAGQCHQEGRGPATRWAKGPKEEP